MIFNKKLNRRKVLQSVPASLAFLAMPAVWSSARAASEYTLTFGHTFGKATEGVMILALMFSRRRRKNIQMENCLLIFMRLEA